MICILPVAVSSYASLSTRSVCCFALRIAPEENAKVVHLWAPWSQMTVMRTGKLNKSQWLVLQGATGNEWVQALCSPGEETEAAGYCCSWASWRLSTGSPHWLKFSSSLPNSHVPGHTCWVPAPAQWAQLFILWMTPSIYLRTQCSPHRLSEASNKCPPISPTSACVFAPWPLRLPGARVSATRESKTLREVTRA